MLNSPLICLGLFGMGIFIFGIAVFVNKLTKQAMITAIANTLSGHLNEEVLKKMEDDIKTRLRINKGIIIINKINRNNNDYYYEAILDARETLKIFQAIRIAKLSYNYTR